jgi:hypothetical protein
MNKATFIVILAIVMSITSASAEQYGRFSGDPEARLVGDRNLILLQDFWYEDPLQRTWLVPSGYETNGASIPQFFWTFVGGPWSGGYRNAAIEHDYFCEFIGPPSDEVHLMFYHAMLANGVAESKAYIMYQAVSIFGENWEIVTEEVPQECIPGSSFEPSSCVFNDSGSYEIRQTELTGDAFDSFLASVVDAGYAADAAELRMLWEAQSVD